MSAVAPTNDSQSMGPDELRKWIDESARTGVVLWQPALAAADAWEAQVDRIANGMAVLAEENAELRKSYEVLRSGIRSVWHGVVDGDMDKLSVGYALKELMR